MGDKKNIRKSARKKTIAFEEPNVVAEDVPPPTNGTKPSS